MLDYNILILICRNDTAARYRYGILHTCLGRRRVRVVNNKPLLLLLLQVPTTTTTVYTIL